MTYGLRVRGHPRRTGERAAGVRTGLAPGCQRSTVKKKSIRFARLVDEARFQAASRLLREPAIRIIDVSVALGYTDAANFTRTFRHWAGVSPLALRRAASLLDARAG